jgi:hypothetical protein
MLWLTKKNSNSLKQEICINLAIPCIRKL